MSSSDLGPQVMQRVAVVAPRDRARAVLVDLAAAGVMQLDHLSGHPERGDEAARVGRGVPADARPRLLRDVPDLDELRAQGAWDLVAGEAELVRRRGDAVEHGPATILLGWVPAASVEELATSLAVDGASVVAMPRPRVLDPPTRMDDGGLHRALRPLVQTYAVVPYEDVDPSFFAGLTYVLMFGMMFGDVGHGLVLALIGAWLARTTDRRVAPVRHLWPFPVAAGLVAAVFGLLYGEAFGPTGWVPTLWLAPLDDPVQLLVVAVGAGAALIAGSYVIGTVNRWREGGFRRALYAQNGLAGALLFSGAALLAAAVATDTGQLLSGALLTILVALVLTFVGLRAEAGTGTTATAQAAIELFDTVIRIGANVVSFGRLAAFGLTHAAIGYAVWEGTTSLWGPGPRAVAAIAVFVVGNALAFVLEALVVGVQALRLEYYELFSRIFSGEGQLFDPWHVPVESEEPT